MIYTFDLFNLWPYIFLTNRVKASIDMAASWNIKPINSQGIDLISIQIPILIYEQSVNQTQDSQAC